MSWHNCPVAELHCVYPVMPVSPGQEPVPKVAMAATVVDGEHVLIGRLFTLSASSERRYGACPIRDAIFQ